jgi:hypothetical protein
MERFSGRGLVHPPGMSLERFHDLEHEYRQTNARIAETLNLTALAVLVKRRDEIVVEARDIARRLKIPSPRWNDGIH